MPAGGRRRALRDRAAWAGQALGAGVGRVARRPRWQPDDVAAGLLYLGFALLLTFRLWGSAATENLDQAQFQFYFEHAAWTLTHGHNPLFTRNMGAPLGVNLMSNTAFLGVTVPLIPVTLLLGSNISYGLALMVGLAGTAIGWYVVLRRHISKHRGVAFVAGALCGFGPGIAGHALGHPNFVAQFLLPFIVSGVVGLRTTARPARSGLVLGLLIAYQVFINEELLLLTALACAVMVVVYLLTRPRQALDEAPRFLAGLGVAAGGALALTAYPLWFQFAGPQHAHGPIHWAAYYYHDLAALPGYPRDGISGWLGVGSSYNHAMAETNGLLGLPLLVVALVTAIGLWNLVAVRIAAVVTVAGLLLSLGDPIHIRGKATIAGPYHLVRDLPLFDSVIVSRFGLIATPAVAVLFAIAAEKLIIPTATGGQALAHQERRRQVLAWAALAALLLPIAPMPIAAAPAMPVPRFFTGGAWRAYVDHGTVVPVPPGTMSASTLQWILATNLQVRFVGGYFLGPTSDNDPTMRYGPPDRPTRLLLQSVADSGTIPELSDLDRATALDDLRFWQADALVLEPQLYSEQMRQTLDQLLGRPGMWVDGVWVWEVRDLV
jgi:hypothetical protein